MPSNKRQIEVLQYILENSLQPWTLDKHPWTKSLFANQAAQDKPDLKEQEPGRRLVLAVAALFIQMMPAIPPRKGKRLDTHWAEFGLLAARYFAPILYGETAPSTLRDAWGRMDQSILLFAKECNGGNLSPVEQAQFSLVGKEPEVAPNSTLSDWHRNGLEKLLDLIIKRESFLSGKLDAPSGLALDGNVSRMDEPVDAVKQTPRRLSKVWLVLLLVFVAGLVAGAISGGITARKIYLQAVVVRQDALQMRAALTGSGSKLERIRMAGPALKNLTQDYALLKSDTQSYLWITSYLGWIPKYGGDLTSVKDLETIADSLLHAGDLLFQAAGPVLNESSSQALDPWRLTGILAQNQSLIIQAQQQVYDVEAARGRLEIDQLDPQIRSLLTEYLDPNIPLIKDGLTVAEELPLLMGATNEGPKTYLIMVQNQDELRPTGGLVTAVGTVLVQNGKVISMIFEDEDQEINPLVDWSKPYPAAPWQLQQYMNSRVLLMRDTSWFTNYPAAALYAKTLYAYVKGQSADGVIAFDQQFLVELLQSVGPINVEGVDTPIDADNVISYMRAAKTPTAAELATPGWTNKLFIKLIADSMLKKMESGDIPLEPFLNVVLQALNERHLLLQLDSLPMTTLLAERHWDGAVNPQKGDFLMVVDTNVGFNKTNAVVSSNYVYDVDLTKPSAPAATLSVVHQNNAAALICKQWAKIRAPGEEDYPITDCYWNYLRVYMPGGTKLLDARPQFIPANWLIVKQDVPARVDTLDEGIAGVQAFGTLQVVPGGESLMTSFHFALPETVVVTNDDSGQFTYHLFVQKQPGTIATPILIRVHLPSNAAIVASPQGALLQDGNIVINTDLRMDLNLQIVFRLP